MEYEVPGISMYFTSDQIYVRKDTITALRNPEYVHLYLNRGNKLLFIVPCEKDRDSFRIYYDEWVECVDDDGKVHKEPQLFFINARRLLDLLAKVVGVKRDSVSLRFAGILHDGHVIINLKKYEVVQGEKMDAE